MTESFEGWTIKTTDGWMQLKKGSRGLMIRLPKKSARLSEKRREKKNIRLRDLESVWGDETAKRDRPMDTLMLTFDVDGESYHFTFLSDEEDTLVIHGWAHWDGDIFGFHIERLG